MQVSMVLFCMLQLTILLTFLKDSWRASVLRNSADSVQPAEVTLNNMRYVLVSFTCETKSPTIGRCKRCEGILDWVGLMV